MIDGMCVEGFRFPLTWRWVRTYYIARIGLFLGTDAPTGHTVTEVSHIIIMTSPVYGNTYLRPMEDVTTRQAARAPLRAPLSRQPGNEIRFNP